jgi:hypothetical protein
MSGLGVFVSITLEGDCHGEEKSQQEKSSEEEEVVENS